jgi:hypothetical protein
MPDLRSLLLVPTLLVPGCLVNDFDSRGDFHDVTVNWSLKNLDGTTMSACAPGFDTLVLHLYKVGYVEPADGIVTAPCTPTGSLMQSLATSGELGDPATGAYDYEPHKDIYLDITEPTQTVSAATSSLYHVELRDDLTIDFDIYPEGKIGVAAWRLQSKLTTAYIPSCEAADVDTVEFWARPFDDKAPLVKVGSFPCDYNDPYYYYDPVGSGRLIDADDFELGSGHTVGLEPIDEGYFFELRAMRGGAIVGTTEESSLSFSFSGAANAAEKIYMPDIVMNDR